MLATRLSFANLVWMAWRHMRNYRKRSGLSIMTAISIGGVSLGVGALIVVLSVMAGFSTDLERNMLRGKPHLEITADKVLAGFSLLDFPVQKFRKTVPEALDVQPFVQADVVLKQRKHLASATIFGIEPSSNGSLWGFGGEAMVEGAIQDLSRLHPFEGVAEESSAMPGIVLGEGLALQMGVGIGDQMTVISPQGATDGLSVLSGGTLTHSFVVIGVFRTNLFNYDSRWAVVNLPEARRFMADYDPSLDEDQFVSGVAMNLPDPYLVESVEKRFEKFAGLASLSWQKSNKSLLFALKLEKFTMGSILMLIVLVAAFSISGTMMMNVYHRRTQVALLRSIGMTKSDIGKLFLMHGITIGSVGILFGLIGGLGMCVAIHNFQFIDLPAGIYALKQLPVKFLPMNYAVICALAFLLTLVAAIYPSITAARQDPVVGLRCE